MSSARAQPSSGSASSTGKPGRAREADRLAGTVEGTRHVDQLIDTDSGRRIWRPRRSQWPMPTHSYSTCSRSERSRTCVFTGQPPATTLAGLTERLQRDGGLEVSAILDGAGEYLAALVREATAGDATQRTSSVADFIDGIALVEEEITAPETARRARGGQAARGQARRRRRRLHVVKRLGRGSTAVALLVHDADDQQRVLKIAADPDRNDRVRDEGEVLTQASRSHDHRHSRRADRRRRPRWTRALVRRRGDARPPPPQPGTAQPRGPRALGRGPTFCRQLPRAGGDPASRHQAREPRDHRGRGTTSSGISS